MSASTDARVSTLEAQLAALEARLACLEIDVAAYRLKRGPGCQWCNGLGIVKEIAGDALERCRSCGGGSQ